MSSFIPHEGSRFQAKSFWKRPEGFTGTVFLVGIISTIAYFLVQYSDEINELIDSTLNLTLLILFIAAILFLFIDPKMRRLMFFVYKSIMRSITSIFVTVDPIGILNNYVKEIRKNIRKTDGQIGKLKSQMRQITGMVDKNKRDIERNLKLAQKAQTQNDQKNLLLNTRKSARLKETNDKYQVLLKKMEHISAVLIKLSENAKILLDDTESQVQLKTQERKAIKAAHSAMSSAKKVIAGDTNERALFNLATEEIAEEIADKVGEMDRFMELSDHFMQSIDLESIAYEDKGMDLLKNLELESDLLSRPAIYTNPNNNDADKNNKYDELF